MPLLEVHGLKTYFETTKGYVKAVDNVSFSLEKGDAFGLAGESGCGKTTTGLSIIKLLPFNGKILDGKIIFDGIDLVEMPEEILRKNIRWKRISIVFQGAMNALNPVYTIGDQIIEAILTHEDISNEEAKERVIKLFELVGIDPSRINNYPFEFSGGMKQRAMIAMALACNPDIVITDEPTTALDVIVQAQVLKLLKKLKEELNLSFIMISHDLSVIAETCNKVAIMYAGKIIEMADVVRLFKNPSHPYSQGLMNSFPSLKGPRKKLISIPGSPPNLLFPPSGCRFHPRCQYVMEKCKEEEPLLIEIDKGHYAACHLLKK
ncbi:MAG: ABC transporter ATP-binding protein [Nitrososphaerota archaeon]